MLRGLCEVIDGTSLAPGGGSPLSSQLPTDMTRVNEHQRGAASNKPLIVASGRRAEKV
jgi:hypothetical protein